MNIEEIYNTEICKIPGWYSLEDMYVTQLLCNRLPKNSTIVEIGTFCGKSASVWSKFAGSVYTYDHCIVTYEDAESEWKVDEFYDEGFNINDFIPQEENIRRYLKPYDNVVFTKETSPIDNNWDNGDIDLLFLDGSKSCKPTLHAIFDYWIPFIKRGGYLTGHDYNPERFPILIEVVQLYAERLNSTIELFNDNYNSEIFAIKNNL